MLNQVSMGKMFADDNIFLQPLNNYVAFTSEKFAQYSLAGKWLFPAIMAATALFTFIYSNSGARPRNSFLNG
jgi:hypothetical protein